MPEAAVQRRSYTASETRKVYEAYVEFKHGRTVAECALWRERIAREYCVTPPTIARWCSEWERLEAEQIVGQLDVQAGRVANALGVTVERAVERLGDLMDATTIKPMLRKGEDGSDWVEEVEIPDNYTRLGACREVLKLHGALSDKVDIRATVVDETKTLPTEHLLAKLQAYFADLQQEGVLKAIDVTPERAALPEPEPGPGEPAPETPAR